MGKQLQGINGPFIGKVGTTVGYFWKKRPCVRTYQKNVRYPNTAEQQRERDWFVSMVRFAAQARQALILGVHNQSEAAMMTEGNYFINRNKEHFKHGQEGLVIDYARLQLAVGPAADVVFHDAVFRDHETISIDFEKNTLFSRASSDDKVYVFVYSPDVQRGMLMMPVERRAKNITFQLPDNWDGAEVHLYGFVVDREGRPSNSTYIGAGRVNHYSEGGNYIPLNKSWLDFVEMANQVNLSDSAAPIAQNDPSTVESENQTAKAPPE